jgi:ribonuclease D
MPIHERSHSTPATLTGDRVGLPKPILITNHTALDNLVDQLSQQPVLAVDTESNSLYAYREQVCLVQFSTPQADYLVDPLALGDLERLGELFASPRIEKVFHAAEYDILCLKRDFGFQFANLFDTMVVARILGRTEVGLGAVLEAEFGVHLDKHFQRANWGQRPLPEPLLAYAQLDTHYLIALRERFGRELEAAGRWQLAQEDFARLCKLDAPDVLPGNGGEGPVNLRLNGASELTPQQLAVLQELCRYREEAAERLDRPLFKVLGDRSLVAIAAACPASLADLNGLPGMSPGQIRRYGFGLLEAVQRGLQAAPLYPPRPVRPDEKFLIRLERLRMWRKATAREQEVDSDIILPRDLLFALARANPTNPAELTQVLESVPWRREQYGAQILQALTLGNHSP